VIGPTAVSILRSLARGVFAVAVVTVFVAGFTGRQVAATNFATVFTWPVWVRGLALAAVLVGSLWPTLSPWRTLYDGLCRLEGAEVALLETDAARLGRWPAVVGFLLLVGFVETLTVTPRSPSLTATVVAVYGLFVVAGAVFVGPAWFDRADPLGVLYRLFGRVAPVTTSRSDDGRLVVAVRSPWRGCLDAVADTPTVVFVVAAVYTVSFDGFANTRVYQSWQFGLDDLLGIGPRASILLYVLGLGVFVLTFFLTARLTDTARAFAPTVLPIAAAYEVAHNYTYVVGSLGQLVGIALEPVASVPPPDPLEWLSIPAFWASQVALIVGGHVVAVVAAHRVAVDRFPSLSAARRGHLPLVVLMVGYTVLSLWIVSQPVVR
jgi:hypothetical protein